MLQTFVSLQYDDSPTWWHNFCFFKQMYQNRLIIILYIVMYYAEMHEERVINEKSKIYVSIKHGSMCSNNCT